MPDEKDLRIQKLETEMKQMREVFDNIFGNSNQTQLFLKRKISFDKEALIGFFGADPIKKPSASTTSLTLITHTAPSADDFAFANTTNSSPWGFSNQNEANTLLKVIANLQTRLTETETKLQSLGLTS